MCIEKAAHRVTTKKVDYDISGQATILHTSK